MSVWSIETKIDALSVYYLLIWAKFLLCVTHQYPWWSQNYNDINSWSRYSIYKMAQLWAISQASLLFEYLFIWTHNSF